MGLWERALAGMGILQPETSRRSVEQRSIEDPTVNLAENPQALLQMLGVLDANNALPQVSIEAALQVPAVFSTVAFLSRTMAALPLHTFESGENGERVQDGPADLLSFAANEEETAFEWRQYHWQQVFTGGRGITWIERAGTRPVALWSLDPGETTIRRRNGKLIYRYDGKDYAAADVIDTKFMPKRDRLGSYGPISKCNKAISLAIAMGNFAGSFFAGGGVMPLALQGPLPNGSGAFQRAQSDIMRAIELSRKEGRPFFGIPPGYELKPVGVDPDKGQMHEARLFQIQEIARIWQLPPVFVGDLSKGTFSNTEQQDLQLVKHLIGQWATAFEKQLTLKLYGWRNPRRIVKHNLDGLQRGAFKERIEALARAIMTGQLTPDEARALEQRKPQPGGNRLYIQQATVPLEDAGKDPMTGHNGGPPLDDNEEGDDGDAGTETEE